MNKYLMAKDQLENITALGGGIDYGTRSPAQIKALDDAIDLAIEVLEKEGSRMPKKEIMTIVEGRLADKPEIVNEIKRIYKQNAKNRKEAKRLRRKYESLRDDKDGKEKGV